MTTATEPARVELSSLGFYVAIGADIQPRTLPGNVLIFHARFRAQQYADALNRDDIEACHQLIAEHGRFWKVGA